MTLFSTLGYVQGVVDMEDDEARSLLPKSTSTRSTTRSSTGTAGNRTWRSCGTAEVCCTGRPAV